MTPNNSSEKATNQGSDKNFFNSTLATIRALETSKEQSEKLLDRIPQLVVIVKKNGDIIRGNQKAAELFTSDIESLLDHNIFELFDSQQALKLQEMLNILKVNSKHDLETDLSLKKFPEAKTYLWSMTLFQEKAIDNQDTYFLIGNDITALRETQKEVSRLMNCIPLGILTINADLNIEPPFSRYLNELTGNIELDGLKAHEILFAGNADFKTESGHKLSDLFGLSQDKFYKVAKELPQTLEFEAGNSSDEGGKVMNYLSANYHPIIADEKTYKLVAVLQNRTEIIMAQKEATVAKEKVNTDVLTGIHNRRFFNEMLDLEMKRCSRSSTPFSIIMIDIDKFKPYNDNYGHVAGDDCIRRVAQALQKSCRRPGDKAFRYGGEEFAILLPETTNDGAIVVAERARLAILDLQVVHDFNPSNKYVSASFGIYVHSSWPSSRPDLTPEEIVSRADTALYHSKENGRNCYSVYQKEQ